jgi:hypothetical protein
MQREWSVVKRYNVKSEIDLSAWIEEDPTGVLVMAADYDSLAALLKEITEAVQGGMYKPDVLFGAIARARLAHGS